MKLSSEVGFVFDGLLMGDDKWNIKDMRTKQNQFALAFETCARKRQSLFCKVINYQMNLLQ